MFRITVEHENCMESKFRLCIKWVLVWIFSNFIAYFFQGQAAVESISVCRDQIKAQFDHEIQKWFHPRKERVGELRGKIRRELI